METFKEEEAAYVIQMRCLPALAKAILDTPRKRCRRTSNPEGEGWSRFSASKRTAKADDDPPSSFTESLTKALSASFGTNGDITTPGNNSARSQPPIMSRCDEKYLPWSNVTPDQLLHRHAQPANTQVCWPQTVLQDQYLDWTINMVRKQRVSRPHPPSHVTVPHPVVNVRLTSRLSADDCFDLPTGRIFQQTRGTLARSNFRARLSRPHTVSASNVPVFILLI